MIKAVLDTNVLVSSVIKPKSIPGRIVELAFQEIYQLIWSSELIEETTAVILQRPQIRELIRKTDHEIIVFLKALEITANIYSTKRRMYSMIHDVKDNIVLECASFGQADFIVTGDKDLTGLIKFHGIRIITPREFIEIIEPDYSEVHRHDI